MNGKSGIFERDPNIGPAFCGAQQGNEWLLWEDALAGFEKDAEAEIKLSILVEQPGLGSIKQIHNEPAFLHMPSDGDRKDVWMSTAVEPHERLRAFQETSEPIPEYTAARRN